MTDPGFRRLLFACLPNAVQEILPSRAVPRHEVIAMVQTLIEYRHLDTFEALLSGLRLAVPDHPAVDDVEQLLQNIRFRTI